MDVIIIGGGMVGLSTAMACAQAGLSVAVIDRRDLSAASADGRASALAASSLRMMKRLGVDLSHHLQPIRDMLVVEGDADSPWRLHFEGDGDGADLGALIENRHIEAGLLATVHGDNRIRVLDGTSVLSAEHDATGVRVETDGAVLTGRLMVAADGRHSWLRRQAGISVQNFAYESAALVTIIAHELPHDGLAWQRFLPGGPLAVLPLKDNRAQIVWSGSERATAAAVTLDEAAFLSLLGEHMGHYLGAMRLDAPRQSYPLVLQVAERFSDTRLALVGDAGHVIHPLAGQGLNLGLRDAAALADGLAAARETGQDIGIAGLLEYDTWRNADIRLLGATTHGLAKLTTVKLPAFGHVRRLGYALTNRSTMLKSALKSEAAGDIGTLPELMK